MGRTSYGSRDREGRATTLGSLQSHRAHSQINLTWSDNSDNEAGFKLDRSTSSTFASSVTTVTISSGQTSYNCTGLSAATTYYFRVRAYNSGGSSANSNTAQATTFQGVPAAPSNLTATPFSTTRIDLKWSDNSNDESGFKIERRDDSIGGSWAFLATVGANDEDYSATGLTPASTYSFRVLAYSGGGDSAWSNEAAATTFPVVAPDSLTATAVSASQINLSWSDLSNNESRFCIERLDGTWTQIATVAANSSSHSVTGLSPGTSYSFRLRAQTDASSANDGYSAFSNTDSAMTFPSVPTNLSATAMSSTRIDLTWSDGPGIESGFYLQRSDAQNPWSTVATLGSGARSYSDTTVKPATTYTYRIRAYNSGGESDDSTTAQATTFAPLPLTVHWSGDGSETDPASHPVRFGLVRTGDCTYESALTVHYTVAGVGSDPASASDYTASGSITIPAGSSSVQLAIVPVDDTEVEALWESLQVTLSASDYHTLAQSQATGRIEDNDPRVPPAAPSDLSATPVSSSRIDLTWQDNSNNESGFTLERSTNQSNWTTISLDKGRTSYLDTRLEAGTTYHYRIKAWNGVGDSPYSNAVNATTLATPVADIDGDNEDDGDVDAADDRVEVSRPVVASLSLDGRTRSLYLRQVPPGTVSSARLLKSTTGGVSAYGDAIMNSENWMNRSDTSVPINPAVLEGGDSLLLIYGSQIGDVRLTLELTFVDGTVAEDEIAVRVVNADMVFRNGSTALSWLLWSDVTHGGLDTGDDKIYDLGVAGINQGISEAAFYSLDRDPTNPTKKRLRFSEANYMAGRIWEKVFDNLRSGSFANPTGAAPWNLFSSADTYQTANCLEWAHEQYQRAIEQVRAELSEPGQVAAFEQAYYAGGAVRNIASPHHNTVSVTDMDLAVNQARAAAEQMPGYIAGIWKWDVEAELHQNPFTGWVYTFEAFDPRSYFSSAFFAEIPF